MSSSHVGVRYLVPAIVCAAFSLPALADPQALDRARLLLAEGNAKQAYEELARLQGEVRRQPAYDYLLGVAALDSGRNDEAIIAFERVLAVAPNHAGAQMDLARAYYATGTYELAEAAFLKLRAAKPPAAAEQAISRYLDAIQQRRNQTQPGWVGFGELGVGYDTNITAVPTHFGTAAQQAFALVGIEATGNSIKREAGFVHGGAGADYARPVGGGWSVFAGGEARGRAYHEERDFDSTAAQVHAGGALNKGTLQLRLTTTLLEYRQEGAAPDEPKPTNDRRLAGVGLEWRLALDAATQVGVALQANRVSFRRNAVEDFDQLFLMLTYLRSFKAKGAPLLYLAAFGSADQARNAFIDGTTKSKGLYGIRAYAQVGVSNALQAFGGAAIVLRRDRDEFARSTQVANGRDKFGELSTGVIWRFREHCTLRMQYAYSTNRSNIDIYDFNRHETSSTVRCDIG